VSTGRTLGARFSGSLWAVQLVTDGVSVHDPMSARLFCPVQRIVGIPEQVFCGVVEVVRDHRRHACTNGHLMCIAIDDPEVVH
jgi:hypothetical protein